MIARVRLRLLGGLALAAGLWSAWVVYQSGDVVAPEASRRARVPQRVAAAAAPARNLTAQPAAQALATRGAVTVAALRNPFEAVPWRTPRDAPQGAASNRPAAPPAIVEPPTAVAEPPAEPPLQLPYKYLGMYADQGAASPSVFLVLGERLIVARPGDMVEGGFRLDAVGAAELTFVHVERNMTLRLSVAKGSL